MSLGRIVVRVQGLVLVLLCSGCTTSVRDIYVQDSAALGDVNLNYHHQTGKAVTQLEFQGVNFSDALFIGAAKDDKGIGEQRLRDTGLANVAENHFIGVGEVRSDYQLQQVTVRSLFQLNNRKLIQFHLGPELTLLKLDSKYSSGQRHLETDAEKAGIGIMFTARWQMQQKLSLNGSASFNLLENESGRSMHQVFMRFQPYKHFHVDAGVYHSFFAINDDQISYEERMFPTSCITRGECTYEYDGTQNSDLEIELTGLRVGIGLDF